MLTKQLKSTTPVFAAECMATVPLTGAYEHCTIGNLYPQSLVPPSQQLPPLTAPAMSQRDLRYNSSSLQRCSMR
jgi:hypothetical protein